MAPRLIAGALLFWLPALELDARRPASAQSRPGAAVPAQPLQAQALNTGAQTQALNTGPQAQAHPGRRSHSRHSRPGAGAPARPAPAQPHRRCQGRSHPPATPQTPRGDSPAPASTNFCNSGNFARRCWRLPAPLRKCKPEYKPVSARHKCNTLLLSTTTLSDFRVVTRSGFG